MNKQAALILWKEAHSYPRQGEGWPATDLEEAAQDYIAQHEIDPLTGRTEAEEAAIEAAYQVDADARAAAAASQASARAVTVAAAAKIAGDDVVKFLKAIGSASTEEVTAALGVTDRRLAGLKSKRLITTNRRGEWVA